MNKNGKGDKKRRREISYEIYTKNFDQIFQRAQALLTLSDQRASGEKSEAPQRLKG